MFALGQRSASSSTDSQDVNNVLVLSEDEETLEFLFRFIDPRKGAGKISQDNVTRLLTASEKYQIPQIPQIVEGWFSDRQFGNPGQGFILQHPMLVFTIATRFNLVNTVKAATERLMECPLKNIAVGSPPEIGRLLHARQKRTDWLLDKCNQTIDAVLKPRYLCSPCNSYRTKWITGLISGVVIQPTWWEFSCKANPSYESKCGSHVQMSGVDDWSQCPGARQGLSSLKKIWKKWEKEARAMEAKVPSLV